MKTFPMFLAMTGRRVVICGGNEETARKVRLVLKTEAEIVIVAEHLVPELADLVASGRARQQATCTAKTFDNAALAFIATGDDALDADLARRARRAGAVVNVIDRPELCDAFTPSIVDRDPVVVAIGTEGNAPVLGRRIKTDIETMLPVGLGAFAALAGGMRDAVAERIPPAHRRRFWEDVFSGSAFRAYLEGRREQAVDLLRRSLDTGAASETRGHIALVGAGPGARDLLTLRAVQRLQAADVIFYDRLVDPEVLELARRDADRVFVGKEVGRCAWPQDEIDRLIVAEARKGRRVVRLKSGDPSVFGRASEEIAAADAAGIEIEIVPGITAASAAAAALRRPLTERGETDTVVLTTAVCRPGDDDPDRTPLVAPGISIAFYMAVGKAQSVERDLLAAGAPAACPVDIVASAGTPRERRLATTLGELSRTIAAEGVQNPAILLVRYPKSMAPAAAVMPWSHLEQTPGFMAAE